MLNVLVGALFSFALMRGSAMWRVSRHHPTEVAAIGRMLARYPDLEFGLLEAINAAHEDFDALFKAMFRARGETRRLEIANARGRNKFYAIELGADFEMTMGVLQRCLKIRNQYAHCLWHISPQVMGFVNLEERAKDNKPLSENPFTYRKTTPALVKQQESFFGYAEDLLLWLQEEAIARHGKPLPQRYPKPKQEELPPLYIE
jgi:hypothetical protein